MSSEGKIYVGQIGVLLEVETQDPSEDPIDWAQADVTEIHMLRPDASEVIFDAVVAGSVLQYTTINKEELHLSGTYLIQAFVSGENYAAFGETARFKVFDRYK
ncbi:MAG: hypothetical protein ACNA8H_14305 [Anaerolineales bacterium]